MSDLYRVACTFERTRIVAHLDHVVHGGCWRCVDSFESPSLDTPFYIDEAIFFPEMDEASGFFKWSETEPIYMPITLNILTSKKFKPGSYINPAKELRPYITPRRGS